MDVLASKNVAKFGPILEREADFIVDHLLKETEEKGSIDVVKPLQFATMNFLFVTCLGMRATSVKDPLFVDVITVIDKNMKMCGVAEDTAWFLPILSVLDFILRKEVKQKAFIEEKRNPLFRRLIKESLASGEDSLTKSLYALKDETGLLDDDGIMVTISKFLIVSFFRAVRTPKTYLPKSIDELIGAGADTTSGTLAWTFSILSHYPEIQAELIRELDAFIAVNKRIPKFNERESLPYMISVQKECMRFRPPTHFGLLHEAQEDGKFDICFDKRHTTSILNVFRMQFNAEATLFPREASWFAICMPPTRTLTYIPNPRSLFLRVSLIISRPCRLQQTLELRREITIILAGVAAFVPVSIWYVRCVICFFACNLDDV